MSWYEKNKRSKPKQDNSKSALRKCLSCGDKFDSFGPGNRICPKCKDTKNYIEGTAGLFTAIIPGKGKGPS